MTRDNPSTSINLVTLHHNARMSEAAYDAERAQLRETYGDSRQEAGARFEQALAALFHRSGWTQEELATKEGKSQQHIARLLRFGRFLSFTPIGVNSELLLPKLTEGSFRKFWEQTDGDERLRFREVARLMEEALAFRRNNRPKIGALLVEKYADGKWHNLAVMAKGLNTDEEHVASTLVTMMSLRGAYGARAEKKTVGTEVHYRLFKMEKTISSHEMVEKLAPIVKALEEQGRKNQVTMSVATVAVLASQLRKLLDGWSE